MRKIVPHVFAIMSLTILATGLFAEENSLTVTLDPTDAAKSDLRLKHETTGLTSDKAPKQTAKSSDKKDVVVGRIGVITASKAQIKRTASRKSPALYVCPKDTYLAIIGEKGDWHGVLMSDSSTGWIEKSKVSVLDYEVSCKVPDPGKSSAGCRIVDTALRYLGIGYKWGGYSLNGLDCSGFVKAVFASHGFKLPRTAREQVNVGKAVGWKQLEPGDRLYFSCKGQYIDHTGIYIGNGYFVHSSTGRGGVAVDKLNSRKYWSSLVAARR